MPAGDKTAPAIATLAIVRLPKEQPALYIRFCIKGGEAGWMMTAKAQEHLTAIAEVVRTTLSETFRSVRIVNVQVQVEKDSDGGDMLRIFVVLDGRPKDVDARELLGAVRYVRPKLSEIGEEAFPLFSFVSKGEFRDSRVGSA
jgi:hypothetical protein